MVECNWSSLQASEANLGLFMVALERQRSSLAKDSWKTFVKTDSTLKQWRYFLLNDPYTRWGTVKPRGYPGDAVLMDFAYQHASIIDHVKESNEQGKYIYSYTSSAPQSLSAISRTKFIGSIVENKSHSRRISVASVASGHGREFECITKQSLANIESLLAVDSDNASLDVLKKSIPGLPVKTLNKNIFKIRLRDYGAWDLIYSLGLFD